MTCGMAELTSEKTIGEARLDMMVGNVLPAIQSARRHTKTSTTIYLDGVKVCFTGSIQEDINLELKVDGSEMKLEQQPPHLLAYTGYNVMISTC